MKNTGKKREMSKLSEGINMEVVVICYEEEQA